MLGHVSHQPAPARAASDTSAQSHFTSRAQGRPGTMPLEVLLPACTVDGSASTSSWAQGRRLSDLSVQGDAHGAQQSTLHNEEVNKQPTDFSACIAARGALSPARPFFWVVRWGSVAACLLLVHMAAPGAPAACARRARAGSGAAPLQVLNLVRRVRGGAVDLERLCLNAVRPRSSVTAVVTLLTPGQLPTVQPRHRHHDGVRARSC